MTRIYATLLGILVGYTTYSQETETPSFILQGTNVVGGSINYSKSTSITSSDSLFSDDNTAESKNLTLNAEYSIAIVKHLALGLELSYTKFENDNFPGTTNKTTTISPLVRKYFFLSSKFAFNLQGQVNFIFGEVGPPDSKDDTKGYGASIKPGITYFLSKKFALTANLGDINYTSLEIDFSDSDLESEIETSNINLGLSNLTIGAVILF